MIRTSSNLPSVFFRKKKIDAQGGIGIFDNMVHVDKESQLANDEGDDE